MVEESHQEKAIGALRWLPWLVGIGVLIWLVAVYGKPAHAPQVSAPAPTAAPTPAPAPEPAAVPAPAPSPSAKLYFAVGKTNMPQDAAQNLAAVTEYLKANPASKAVISGFHDPTGNKAQNQELARKRAKAVSEALKAAGIGEERVVLQKPQETAGAGNDAEARRVEVTIQE